MVSYCLKIPTYQEHIDFPVVSRLKISDMFVNRVQLPMTTPFDCDLLIVRRGEGVAKLELAFILVVAEIAVMSEESLSYDRTVV